VTEPPRSRLFWPSVVVGAGFAGVGAAVVFAAPADDGRPLGIAAIVAALVLAHDVLVAPLTHATGRFAARRLPADAVGPIRGALAVTAVLVLFAVPLVAGLGRRPTNSSTLPMRYYPALAVLIGAVWLVAGAVILARRHRR
jgi:hypothetical protein